MAVLDFVVNVLSTPSILVGLLALVGLALQKKPVEDVVRGTVRTIVGFLVLTAGSSYLQSGSLNAFGELFNYAFDMQGVLQNSDAVVSLALTQFGSSTAIIMCLGMLANIVAARFSHLHYIFLTSQHTLYMAAMLAVVLSVGGLDGWALYLAGGCLLGLVMVVSPALLQPTMRKITGGDGMAMGHFGGFGYWVSAQVGKLFRGGRSTEDVRFPRRLVFLRDTTVSVTLTMVVLFVVVTGAAVGRGVLSEDPARFSALSGLLNVGTETTTNWVVWALTSAAAFAGGVYIILAGVSLIIGEIQEAFKGIAERLVPGAVPCLDCPVCFTYAPNAVVIGFLMSFLGGVVGLGALVLINANVAPVALILPGVVPHFFCGATAGVFGNTWGGVRGCVAGAFVHGLLITFLAAACMPVMGALGFAGTTYGDADFTIVGILFGNLAQYVGGLPLVAICVGLYLVPVLYGVVADSRSRGEKDSRTA
ncbi:PTS ascorbate transporter subunit IIC [Olsenella sp. An188]|uniref:PTS ascorbate transporter subunit IIC n=1 Tax=Olsenella sp. An188 TaxID=1965579 RepID=UPI000B3717F0|nr:PTS ascorbate transporter subunit IIC [Olsenella sp. An188]OUP38091.1 PTS ascorbate transporter subunit IIC [Olsenella sp. An188]